MELPSYKPPWDYSGDLTRSLADATLVDFDGVSASFSWPALPAGTYRIEVRAPGVITPLAAIDGVRVERGHPGDPRLDAIDVRSAARTLLVSIVPVPSGPLPITIGGVLAFPAGSQASTLHGLLFDGKGQARLLVGFDPVDLVVAVPGFRLWRAHSVTDTKVEVQLEPCITVSCRLAPRVAERMAGHAVQIALEPDHAYEVTVEFLRPGEREPALRLYATWLQTLAGSGKCDLADGKATGTIAISTFGTFHVQLNVPLPAGGCSCLHVPAKVEVTRDGQPIVIDVDDGPLSNVLDELSRLR
jgi:hypothetical protein